ncbi:hypothetical protein [Hungatella hathewayi]|uniref:WxL domain-containing protein n=1 Tax=Hungatella hathewayi WAL-18680 TaxID=742737 RepID=G5ICN0_9FIRM|nr:hypothetical protein [Hungatella hathewayi]EHI60776.1 hypothetical protein HMPREF9473_01340 [ [Hungatella hathewayi WAL-18680]MBS4985132.1 hypothetical protein [Hungatella hathewayi]
MNKRLKKVTALAMAAGMAVTGNSAAYAAAPAAGATVEETVTVNASTGSNAPSELTGYIAISNINVVVPVKAGFDIDPNTATNLTTGHGRIQNQASNYTITNNSQLKVKVKISSVASTVVTLTQTENEALNNSKNLMLSVRKKGAAAPAVATSGDWLLQSDISNYKLDGTSSECILEPTGAAGGADKLDMELFGITGAGWTGSGATFTVTPTFTISLAN